MIIYVTLILGVAVGWDPFLKVVINTTLVPSSDTKVMSDLGIDLEGITKIVYFVVYPELLSFFTIINILDLKTGKSKQPIGSNSDKSKFLLTPYSLEIYLTSTWLGFFTKSFASLGLADLFL